MGAEENQALRTNQVLIRALPTREEEKEGEEEEGGDIFISWPLDGVNGR